MNDLYSEYFGTGDVYDGLGKLLYARKQSKISDIQMRSIVDELVKTGKIEETSSFVEKPWWQWNERYVSYLMNGLSAGRVSRDYLLYYSKVRKVSTIKKIALIVVVLIAIVVLASEIISSHNAG